MMSSKDKHGKMKWGYDQWGVTINQEDQCGANETDEGGQDRRENILYSTSLPALLGRSLRGSRSFLFF